MKKIRSGLQYRVFLLSGTRVQKRPTSSITKFLRLLRWTHFLHPLCAYRQLKRATEHGERSIAFFKTHSSDTLQALIGNPSFSKGPLYEQDKVIVLGDALEHAAFEVQKELISKLLQHYIKCLQYGFADTTFNFTINNGVDSGGDVILLDLGEVTTEKEVIHTLFENESWKEAWSYKNMKSGKLQDFITAAFREHLTTLNLDRYWKQEEEC